MNPLLMMRLQKLNAEMELAKHRIATANSLYEIIRWSTLSIPVELRMILKPASQQVRNQAECRAKEMTRRQIDQISRCRSLPEGKAMRNRLMLEWQSMSGYFPSLFLDAQCRSIRALDEIGK